MQNTIPNLAAVKYSVSKYKKSSAKLKSSINGMKQNFFSAVNRGAVADTTSKKLIMESEFLDDQK